jgi:hypothetical protein
MPPHIRFHSSDEEDFVRDSARQRRRASQQAQPENNNNYSPPGTRQTGSFTTLSYRERRNGQDREVFVWFVIGHFLLSMLKLSKKTGRRIDHL